MDMATHCYDLLQHILQSKITSVYAMADTQTFAYQVDDSSTTLLRFANGAHAVVDAFYNIPDAAGRGRLEIYGNKGSLLAEGTIGQDPGGKMIAYISDSSKDYDPQQAKEALDVSAREISADPVNMYAAELDYMSRCIETGSEPHISTGEDGLVILKTALAAYESAKSGRSVEIR